MIEFIYIVLIVGSVIMGIMMEANRREIRAMREKFNNNCRKEEKAIKYKWPDVMPAQPPPEKLVGAPQPIDDNKVKAQNTLVTIGYTVTEAKKMLVGITASTAEQYVSEAMKRVKI